MHWYIDVLTITVGKAAAWCVCSKLTSDRRPGCAAAAGLHGAGGQTVGGGWHCSTSRPNKQALGGLLGAASHPLTQR